ncbi:hypothetical protein HY625_03030 [Candidatus Uhrbacteria bacterium]|nr:hypothetical protein [Candidatus Uhrbacteria bacterium]
MAKKHVKKMRLFIDGVGNTMHIWWDDPKHAHHAEEAAKSFDVIIFDKRNHPIGFEKLGVFPREIDPVKYISSRLPSLLVAK